MMIASTYPIAVPMRLAVPLLAATTLAACATTASPIPAPRPVPRPAPAVSLGSSHASGLAVPLAKARERYLTVSLGSRSLIGNDWDAVDNPTTLGLTYDGRQLGQSLGLEAGAIVSFEDSSKGGADIDATILEGFIGMRNTWGYDGSIMRPYWAIGGTIMRVMVDSDTPSVIPDFDEDTIGFYFRLGTRVQVSKGAALGIEYRLVRGTNLSVDGFGEDADYGQISLNFGWAF